MAGQDYDDLRGFDLSRLDLEHIELDIDRPPNPLWRWLMLLVLVAIGITIAVVGSRTSLQSSGASFVLSIGAVVVGLTIGRWLWGLALARAAIADTQPEEPVGPPSALARWMTFLVGGGGAVAVIVMVRNGTLQAWFGEGSTFAAAAMAIGVGVVLGRWLMQQGEVARAARENVDEAPPIRLPPWFKWVTLGVIVAVGIAVLIGSNLSSSGGEGFGLGGIGFACGIAAAIWLARRFDELENKSKKTRRRTTGRFNSVPTDLASPRNVRHLPVGRSRWRAPGE